MFHKLVKLRDSKRAFTLIELMVVVAIIAILAAIAIPAYMSYRENAKRQVAQSSFIAVLDSYNSYIAIYEDPYPINASPVLQDVVDYLETNTGETVVTDHLDLSKPFYNPGPAVKLNDYYVISDTWTDTNDWADYYLS